MAGQHNSERSPLERFECSWPQLSCSSSGLVQPRRGARSPRFTMAGRDSDSAISPSGIWQRRYQESGRQALIAGPTSLPDSREPRDA